jgi:hypothetical protein
MMNLSSVLLGLSAAIVFILGSAHLYFTFNGDKFYPRDADLTGRLKQTSPRISRQTTMWNAALGFHASHSLGAILFGLIYFYLSIETSHFLFHSLFLQLLGLAYLSVMLVLAFKFWFSLPFRGLLVASSLYLGGILFLII